MIIFLVVATLFIGDPFGDWFMSAHGIVVADKQKSITEAENVEIYRLLSRGLVVSSDSIISNMTDLYGNMIQVLIGVLAVATVFAFFAVRWQSIQAAEDFVDSKTKAHFNSHEFKALMKVTATDYIDSLDPQTNPQVSRGPLSADFDDALVDIRLRMDVMEGRLRSLASAEEGEEGGEEIPFAPQSAPTPPARAATKRATRSKTKRS